MDPAGRDRRMRGAKSRAESGDDTWLMMSVIESFYRILQVYRTQEARLEIGVQECQLFVEV